ncbi:MAG: hypothetical protein FJ135_03015 [Deltaproteobacteria bacterium]|nr:hypothetical protein [Deltaproteobacteria bacterium]
MSKAITEFPRNTKEKIVLSLSEFKGRHYLDMRLYLVGENGGPDIPTKKGLTLAVGLYPHLKEALAQVEAALISRGLVDREDLEVQG